MSTEVAQVVLMVDNEATARQYLISRHLEECVLTVFEVENAPDAMRKFVRYPQIGKTSDCIWQI